MASQRDIRRRIGAVKNIKQITRAMQFVAASKLKRAQDATLASRPYSDKIDEVLADVAAVLGDDAHPLLGGRDGGKRLIVLITPDRPLSGPLVTNIVRFTAREITEHSGDLAIVTIGRKGRDAMRRSRVPIEAHFASFGDRPSFADVVPITRLITDAFRSGEAGRVDIAYSHFVSTLVQRPTHRPAAADRARPRTRPASPAGSSSSSRRRSRSSSSSSRATSRPASSRRSSRARRARNRAA